MNKVHKPPHESDCSEATSPLPSTPSSTPPPTSPSPSQSPVSMNATASDPGNLFQLKDILSYFAAVKGDLSNITAPPFILAPKSAIEIPACWTCHHDLFLQPCDEPNPGARALLVAKNYVCSLKNLVDADSENAGKKPLNPFLGELFFASFSDSFGSQSRMIVEQVSHHPPVTACSIYNKERGMSSDGFVAQETSFSLLGGVTVRQTGYAIIKDDNHNEQHLMTMPTILVKGVATGHPYPELQGPSYISSSSGYVTKIQFQGRGRFGFGEKNQVTAEVFAPNDKDNPLYRITGQWTGRLTTQDSSHNTLEEFHVDQISTSSLHVAPIDEQAPWESRRAWWKVTEAIKQGNIEQVYAQKSALEESQRRRRAEEQKTGAEWNALFFAQLPKGDPLANSLIQNIADEGFETPDLKRTAGAWKFVGIEPAEELRNSLSEDSSPTTWVSIE
ncbi:hypothetical protein F66182_2534 [Fusarium sp. NRRL 66182]|nr:hypothetical protein F66182_2534 [Fusarium sp. NRRL 66182]